MTVEETPGVEIDGQRGRIRASNRLNTNLKRKQPESCSVSDQVANVKQSIQDTLNIIRHFRAELETREKNLEASLLEVDDLGMFLNQDLLAFLDIIIFWYTNVHNFWLMKQGRGYWGSAKFSTIILFKVKLNSRKERIKRLSASTFCIMVFTRKASSSKLYVRFPFQYLRL